jgi:hypothetical protein
VTFNEVLIVNENYSEQINSSVLEFTISNDGNNQYYKFDWSIEEF